MADNHLEIFTQLYLAPWLTNESKVFEQFLNLGRKKIYKKDTPIVNQGDMVENIFYLKKGKAKVSLATESGYEKLFWYTTEGNILGDVPFYCEMPSNSAIIAHEDCEVYIFDKKDFLKIIKSEPQIAEYMLKTMAKKVKILTGQMHDIFNKPLTRLSKFLYLLSKQIGKNCTTGTKIELNITHKEIAAITGLHRVTVTNVLNDLKEKGIIKKSKKGSIIIIDETKLQEIALNVPF